tara:strand:- start:463 stop:636 length:174 start_codon:yes stop_codon:yes gene_type:complete
MAALTVAAAAVVENTPLKVAEKVALAVGAVVQMLEVAAQMAVLTVQRTLVVELVVRD